MSLLLVLAMLSQQGQGPLPTVPVAYSVAAAGHPLDFAQMLTHLGVPVGLEIRQEDYVRRRPVEPWMLPIVDRPREEPDTAQPGVTLQNLLDAFNRSHEDYSAALAEGVVVIRPIASRFEYLASASPVLPTEMVGVMTAARGVLAPWGLGAPGFVGGSFSSPVGTEVDRGAGAVLRINTAGKTVLDVLNEVVRQERHHGWVIITATGSPQNLKGFGFLHRHLTGEFTYIGENPFREAEPVPTTSAQ